MHSNAPVDAFWQRYLDCLAPGSVPPHDTYETWQFGDTEALANDLAERTKIGVKTATSSLLWEDEANGEAVPTVGMVAVVTTWDRSPVCIIHLTAVTVQPFNAIDDAFAWAYGEGDRTLTWWRQAMWDYYAHVCATIGRTPSDTMPLVCQYFRLLFPTDKPAASAEQGIAPNA